MTSSVSERLHGRQGSGLTSGQCRKTLSSAYACPSCNKLFADAIVDETESGSSEASPLRRSVWSGIVLRKSLHESVRATGNQSGADRG